MSDDLDFSQMTGTLSGYFCRIRADSASRLANSCSSLYVNSVSRRRGITDVCSECRRHLS